MKSKGGQQVLKWVFFSLFWKFQKIKLFFQSHQKNWSVRFGRLSYGLLVSQVDVLQASKKFFLELVFSFLANWDFLKPSCEKSKHAQILQFGAQKSVVSIFIDFFWSSKKKLNRRDFDALMLLVRWLGMWTTVFKKKILRHRV